ncbi:nucleoside phosphorylase [Streptomyces sp. NPDC059168]|uniref:nucleoside phosphorylase n=1 Tax=Streptomyces sp. NPDC059168 TaxID=3346753 RepID=UPI0036A951A3
MIEDQWRRAGDPDHRYVDPREDIQLHGVSARTCVLVLSGSLFDSTVKAMPHFRPLGNALNPRLSFAHDGEDTLLHFPLYGSPRIAAAVEQLHAVGVRRIIAVGLCGSLSPDLPIGSVVLPIAAVRTDAVGLHYAPVNFPACPDPRLMTQLLNDTTLAARPVLHLSTDALYRETHDFIDGWRALGVETIDMEVGALFVVAKVLGVPTAWVGVVSDQLTNGEHLGAVGAHGVLDRAVETAQHLLNLKEDTSC